MLGLGFRVSELKFALRVASFLFERFRDLAFRAWGLWVGFRGVWGGGAEYGYWATKLRSAVQMGASGAALRRSPWTSR